MHQVEYRFQFSPQVELADAEDTLRLSLLATEGLVGEAKVRTELSFSLHPLQSEIRLTLIDGMVESVAQIYTSLLTHEFGRDAFSVRRVPTAEPAASAA